MRMTIALVAVGASLGGCYQEYQPSTTPPPQFQPQPVIVQGPPGGEIDPGYAYAGPAGEYDDAASTAPSADPQDPDYVMGAVTDAEIDVTLEGYGYWIEDEEYGRIWRPDATVVGVDFTPYETCGTWLWTDYGWTFSCDWSWGWLPFHYGYWGWFDDYWAWVPDYTWSPAQVEWRSGGGYVGWRPIGPHTRDHRVGASRGVRDHRNGDRGPIVRDHRGRRTGDADWRFVADRDFGGGRRIRPSLVHNNAEGLRLTSIVARPPIRATQPAAATRVTDVMKNRIVARDRFSNRPSYDRTRPSYDRTRPTFDRTRPTYGRDARTPSWGSSQPPVYQPTPSRGYDRRPPSQSWSPSSPSRGYDRTPPSQSWSPSSPPSRGYDRTPPSQSWSPSSPPSRSWSPSSPPSSTYTPSSPPARGYDRRPPAQTWSPSSPPSRSWSPPSSTYTPSSPPARSSAPSRTFTPSSPPSRSYSPPSSSSHGSRGSSSSSSSSSGGSSRGSSSHSSGGGRRR